MVFCSQILFTSLLLKLKFQLLSLFTARAIVLAQTQLSRPVIVTFTLCSLTLATLNSLQFLQQAKHSSTSSCISSLSCLGCSSVNSCMTCLLTSSCTLFKCHIIREVFCDRQNNYPQISPYLIPRNYDYIK